MCSCWSVRRSEQPRKLSLPIQAFWPLHKFGEVESVRKIETGLKRGQWLSRIMRNAMRMQQLSTCHSNNQFSQQPLTAFESGLNFPDQCNTHKCIQRPKTSCSTNWQRRFLRLLSSFHVTACYNVPHDLKAELDWDNDILVCKKTFRIVCRMQAGSESAQ
jgi:hypothetical protein